LPVEAAWARHPEARVPDTYRSARFASARSGAIVLEGAVGKYLGRPVKQITVHGTRGSARIDRVRNELQLSGVDGRTFALPGPSADTGYEGLARALALGMPLPPLLTAGQALQALRLVEQAHARAVPATVYVDEGRAAGPFICDWESAS